MGILLQSMLVLNWRTISLSSHELQRAARESEREAESAHKGPVCGERASERGARERERNRREASEKVGAGVQWGRHNTRGLPITQCTQLPGSVAWCFYGLILRVQLISSLESTFVTIETNTQCHLKEQSEVSSLLSLYLALSHRPIDSEVEACGRHRMPSIYRFTVWLCDCVTVWMKRSLNWVSGIIADEEVTSDHLR